MLNARLFQLAGRFLFWATISCGQGMSDISGCGASCRGFTWTTWNCHDIDGSHMGATWEEDGTYRGAKREQTPDKPAKTT